MSTHIENHAYDFPKIFRGLKEAVRVYDEVLERMGSEHRIDEIAYLLPNHVYASTFLRESVREAGCVHFNSATDHVHTEPLQTHYDVLYDFMSVPLEFLNGREVRIEAMHLIDGFSPLHYAELLQMKKYDANCTAIHASFKCEDETAYAAAIHRLQEADWEVAMRCGSSYGRFSYWKPLDPDNVLPDGPYLYLKPRMNLRDAP